MDREKVIKGLECCHNKNMLWQHDQCPYHGFDEDCESNLHADVLELLKEQKTVNWIICKEKLPDKDGAYLVVKSIMGYYYKVDVCNFTRNLHKLDEFDFPKEKRPGWYEYDSETGYFEWTDIVCWAELPELPNECKNER